MIEPIYSLLVQLAQGQRSGMLLLVMMASGSASHIVTLWLRDGEMVHISDRMRRGAAALMVLRHARLLRRWQWFEVDSPAGLELHDLPVMSDFLQFEERHVVPALPEGAPVTVEQQRLERLFAIQTFMQVMGGAAGDDIFMQLLFDHPPVHAWDELIEACREEIGVYFGPLVARQVVDA
ncbi:hypothetical protein [uncultured Hydrogenophaga sp.]|uniref:hypothetical protein n=1 Tax=uncultured Hydrogenophaga sp. TaxID=199683 RepID=UPI00265EA66F|nr:hypothetical protein [uncultured Hydrogenophaga sp.]